MKNRNLNPRKTIVYRGLMTAEQGSQAWFVHQ